MGMGVGNQDAEYKHRDRAQRGRKEPSGGGDRWWTMLGLSAASYLITTLIRKISLFCGMEEGLVWGRWKVIRSLGIPLLIPDQRELWQSINWDRDYQECLIWWSVWFNTFWIGDISGCEVPQRGIFTEVGSFRIPLRGMQLLRPQRNAMMCLYLQGNI